MDTRVDSRVPVDVKEKASKESLMGYRFLVLFE